MSARVGLTPEEYKTLMNGTFFLDLDGNLKRLKKGDGLDSIYGSSKIVDDFNVKNKVYKAADEVRRLPRSEPGRGSRQEPPS